MAREEADVHDYPTPDLLARLERLARLMRAGSHARGLNPAQWEALRYLSRSNRHSRTPGAMTLYLGATKGTISQTIRSLERKGHLTKARDRADGRSVQLDLTQTGRALLAEDPLRMLAADIDGLGGKTRRRLGRGLAELLESETRRQEACSFGQCSNCRHFRALARSDDGAGPHSCMKLKMPVSEAEASLLCAMHASLA
jgi:DNA-binding MarR family transcriptional regulator